MDRSLALEALSAICNANVTTTKSTAQPRSFGQMAPSLSSKNFICTVLNCDECSHVSQCHFTCISDVLQKGVHAMYDPNLQMATAKDLASRKNLVIDEDEFFDPKFDYDYRHLKDTETYYRGKEVYERPCGWYRFAIKVLDNYPDGNCWLGTSRRSTQSESGEWPVSYHGTSKKGAGGIISGHYEAGKGQRYGRGIYSTPVMSEAIYYSKTFVASDGKKYYVVLQNRINPKYREKHNNDKYWLIPIPKSTSDEEEEEMVERSIRPYGLLIKLA